jgi:hypothetical protein
LRGLRSLEHLDYLKEVIYYADERKGNVAPVPGVRLARIASNRKSRAFDEGGARETIPMHRELKRGTEHDLLKRLKETR